MVLCSVTPVARGTVLAYPDGMGEVKKRRRTSTVVPEREPEVFAEFAGVLTGIYEPDELSRLREEWH